MHHEITDLAVAGLRSRLSSVPSLWARQSMNDLFGGDGQAVRACARPKASSISTVFSAVSTGFSTGTLRRSSRQAHAAHCQYVGVVFVDAVPSRARPDSAACWRSRPHEPCSGSYPVFLDTVRFITEPGGRVRGAPCFTHPLRRPISRTICSANGGADAVTCLKQAREFGLGRPDRVIAGLTVGPSVVRGVGLEIAQGMVLTAIGVQWSVQISSSPAS
jgi:hypothetical protein